VSLLEVTGLRVGVSSRRGGRELLHGISFAVQPGERVGLIGESGSGKSLTALAIMGLLPEGLTPAGSIRLGGTEVVGVPERDHARLRGATASMVFQEPMSALNPLMRVGRQVAESLQMHRGLDRAEANAAAVEMLADVELPNPAQIARAYPFQLSGGQRQRVVLAIALASRPRLLICDEPTTALDVTVQARMLALIDRLVDEHGTALLFITHDLAVMAGICDSVLVMYRGDLVEDGSVAEVLTAPQHPYTRGLLAASAATSRSAPGTELPVVAMGGEP
jgi:ABC-type dipeptide/oligopeptide/nickel transport system ATPase component